MEIGKEEFERLTGRKVGKWIQVPDEVLQKYNWMWSRHMYKCSECGTWNCENSHKYCSECGARIEVEADAEENDLK